ncbi:hypothetical protein [Nonomuraea sp. NPDC052265]
MLALARQGRIRARVERRPLAEAPSVLSELESGTIEGRAALTP